MCYIILPVVAFVLVGFSSFSAGWSLFSRDWLVGPDGGKGLSAICSGVKTLETPFSMGQLDNLDQNPNAPLQVNLCDSFSWSNYTTTLEQVLAGLCIAAAALGVIILILIFAEVVLRICFKPHPVTPKITAALCFLQFLAIGAVTVGYAGQISFMVPEGFTIGITYYMMMVSIAASFVGGVLMSWAATSERKRYESRFSRGRPRDAISVDSAMGSTTTLEKEKNGSSLVV